MATSTKKAKTVCGWPEDVWAIASNPFFRDALYQSHKKSEAHLAYIRRCEATPADVVRASNDADRALVAVILKLARTRKRETA